MAAEEEFIRLRDTDKSFQQRSDFVFAQLGDLEPKPESSQRNGRDTNENEERRRRPNRSRLPARVPDFVLSPGKWTKYSLKLDGSEAFRDMNEHNLNKYAAHTFLENLRKRKAEEIEPRTEELGENETKISFRKPLAPPSKDINVSQGSSKGVWKDGSFVMPEYVAGVSRPKERTSSAKRSGVRSPAGCAKVSLGHLDEDGEDDEESTLQSTDVPHPKQKRVKRVLKKRNLDEDEDGKEIGDDECENKREESGEKGENGNGKMSD